MPPCRGIHSYGLLDLIRGFVYLAVAYVMLWVATWVYVAFTFLGFLRLFLPCACQGILGFRSDDLCLWRILIEFPLKKIFYVWGLVERNLVLSENAGGCLSNESVDARTCGKEIVEIGGDDGEGCSVPVARDSGRKRGGGFDVKGKSLENRKQRYGLRRRRKGYAQFRPLNLGSPESGISSCCDNIEMVCEAAKTPESFSHAGVMEFHHLDSEELVRDDSGEKTWDSYELSETFGGSKVVGGGDASSGENIFSNGVDNLCNEDEANRRIRILEQNLAEEKARSAALYCELEEERAAAATAADEAMAMIFRLQEEKAMIEMEVRQSQRMIEEKVAYDEEEMNILKEILIRRERDSFFLENQLLAYKQASLSDESVEDHRKRSLDVLRWSLSSSLIHPNEELEAVHDVHVVDDTARLGNVAAGESKRDSHNSCLAC